MYRPFVLTVWSYFQIMGTSSDMNAALKFRCKYYLWSSPQNAFRVCQQISKKMIPNFNFCFCVIASSREERIISRVDQLKQQNNYPNYEKGFIDEGIAVKTKIKLKIYYVRNQKASLWMDAEEFTKLDILSLLFAQTKRAGLFLKLRKR